MSNRRRLKRLRRPPTSTARCQCCTALIGDVGQVLIVVECGGCGHPEMLLVCQLCSVVHSDDLLTALVSHIEDTHVPYCARCV